MTDENPDAPLLNTVNVSVAGTPLAFELAPDAGGPAFFSMGIRKSGSTMLHKIVIFLARRNDLNVVDIAGTFFKAGYTVADWERANTTKLLRGSNVYLGYRSYPSTHVGTAAFDTSRKILMFRDPRDVLVSQYFSDAFSHSLPKGDDPAAQKGREEFLRKREAAQASSIDDYVLANARGVQSTMMSYEPMLNDPSCLNLRYEEYVFTKKRLIHKILGHFGWTCHPAQVENLLRMVDIVPEKEESQKFVRKAVPGDHRAKLQPETIAKLDTILGPTMSAFDYY